MAAARICSTAVRDMWDASAESVVFLYLFLEYCLVEYVVIWTQACRNMRAASPVIFMDENTTAQLVRLM